MASSELPTETLQRHRRRRTVFAWSFVGVVLFASCLVCGWTTLAYDNYQANLGICDRANIIGPACEDEASRTLISDITSGAIPILLLALVFTVGCAVLWWRNNARVRLLEPEAE